MAIAKAGELVDDFIEQLVVAVERDGAEDLGARSPAGEDVGLEGVLLAGDLSRWEVRKDCVARQVQSFCGGYSSHDSCINGVIITLLEQIPNAPR